MKEYGKYHILEGIYPHIGLHISNNDDPVKTLLTFRGVYNGNSPDIKGNPPYNFYHLIVGVSFHLHILMK